MPYGKIETPADAESLWEQSAGRGRSRGALSIAIGKLELGEVLSVEGKPNTGVFHSAAATAGVRVATRRMGGRVLVKRIA